eukprot:4239760-Prymnesium_polylepis.1
MSESNAGASGGCTSATASISPAASSRPRSRCAASSSSSSEGRHVPSASASACAVGVPSSLNDLRFKIGGGADAGSSPAARRWRSSSTISL